MAPKVKEIERGRCQAVNGEHQCERTAGHKGEHREGQLVWTRDGRLQVKMSKAAKAGESGSQ